MNSLHPAPVEVGVVIVAAGSGQRLGHGIPKARVLCGGRTLLEHAMEAVLLSGIATAVVVVLPEGDDVLTAVVAEAAARSAAGVVAGPAAGPVAEPVTERTAGPAAERTGPTAERTGPTAGPAAGSSTSAATEGPAATGNADAGILGPVRISAVAGGATRTASVRAGLDALPSTIGVVLVHDAARALTPPAVFRRVAAAVEEGAPAVIPVLPVVDTVKVVDGDLVTATPDRAGLRAVQTPQGFDAGALRAAHAGTASADPGVTDDAMLMEALGHAVRVVEGDPLAFKVTTPLDLVIAEAVLEQRPVPGTPGPRTGPHEVSPAGAPIEPDPTGPAEDGSTPDGPAPDGPHAPDGPDVTTTTSRSSRVPE